MWWLLLGCAQDPTRTDPTTVFPWHYTPEPDLEAWEQVRFEEETWDPLVDLSQLALYFQKSQRHRVSAPVEVLAHFDLMRQRVPPLLRGDMRVQLVGDVMWTGGGWAEAGLPMAGGLDGDLRVGNLETPTDPSQPTGFAELGTYAFNAEPELIDGLPLDALQLNNNHTLDAGDGGISATVDQVRGRGRLGFGVDGQGLVDIAGLRVALLAYTWGVNVRPSTSAHDLRVVSFCTPVDAPDGRLPAEPIDLGRVSDDIAAARSEGAEVVIVLPHWGYEYEYYADPRFLVLGRLIIGMGADLIVGTGPHVVQPVEVCAVNPPRGDPGIGSCVVRTPDARPRQAVIAPSLGDFLASPSLVHPAVRTGIVLDVSLGPGGVTGLGWMPVVTEDGPTGGRATPAADSSDPEIAAEVERLSAHLGAVWRR